MAVSRRSIRNFGVRGGFTVFQRGFPGIGARDAALSLGSMTASVKRGLRHRRSRRFIRPPVEIVRLAKPPAPLIDRRDPPTSPVKAKPPIVDRSGIGLTPVGARIIGRDLRRPKPASLIDLLIPKSKQNIRIDQQGNVDVLDASGKVVGGGIIYRPPKPQAQTPRVKPMPTPVTITVAPERSDIVTVALPPRGTMINTQLVQTADGRYSIRNPIDGSWNPGFTIAGVIQIFKERGWPDPFPRVGPGKADDFLIADLETQLRDRQSMIRTAQVVRNKYGQYVHPSDVNLTERIYELKNQTAPPVKSQATGLLGELKTMLTDMVDALTAPSPPPSQIETMQAQEGPTTLLSGAAASPRSLWWLLIIAAAAVAINKSR